MSKALDKFYTKPALVALCYTQLPSLATYDLIVEPSAGSGAFLQPLPITALVQAYDLYPEPAPELLHPIIAADYLTLDPATVRGAATYVLTVGNPPFGRNCSLALQFLKQAMNYSHTVAFILPRSFKKVSVLNKVPLTFTLTSTLDLPVDGFLLDGASYDVPCVFQVWTRADIPRVKLVARTTTELFRFVTMEEASCAVRRVGVNAGRAFLDTERSPQSHYFLALPADIKPEEFVARCNSLTWEHNNTTGPRSISKGELIAQLEACE